MWWTSIVSLIFRSQAAPTHLFTGLTKLLHSVNVFYRVNQEQPDPSSVHDPKQVREFRIGSIGFADTSGIFLAAILAVPTEVELCRAQVARGKYLCQGL